MMSSRPDIPLGGLRQCENDWLVRNGVTVPTMIRPMTIKATTGAMAPDGILEFQRDGDRWLAFEQEEDIVFWQPRRGTFATDAKRAFALGEDIIDNAATYAFDCSLNIFADPLDWLRAGRDGIVVLEWLRAFDRLRDAPRIAIAEELLPLYQRHMRPSHMPQLLVILRREEAA